MTAIEFLRECGAFFVLTAQDNEPWGRPFGAAALIDGEICISTGAHKEVYRQMKANPAVQIVALRSGTRQWLRMRARAEECTDTQIRRAMLESCPALQGHFADENMSGFAVFRLCERRTVLYGSAGEEEIE